MEQPSLKNTLANESINNSEQTKVKSISKRFRVVIYILLIIATIYFLFIYKDCVTLIGSKPISPDAIQAINYSDRHCETYFEKSFIMLKGFFSSPSSTNQPTFCPQDAKLCPDGSSVGRTGPNCEFAQCPSASPASTIPADWKTYTSTKYGFELRYPANGFIVNGSTSKTTRIQNYDPNTAVTTLEYGEFFLEIGDMDSSYNCELEILDPETIIINNITVLKTRNNLDGYPNANVGSIYGICFQKTGKSVWINVHENDKMRPISQQILSTFKFTR